MVISADIWVKCSENWLRDEKAIHKYIKEQE